MFTLNPGCAGSQEGKRRGKFRTSAVEGYDDSSARESATGSLYRVKGSTRAALRMYCIKVGGVVGMSVVETWVM